LQIVGRHLGAGRHGPLLAFERLFPSAAQEKGHVGYFYVSAMRNWVLPAALTTSPSVLMRLGLS